MSAAYPSDLAAAFRDNTTSLSQSQIDWLVRRHAVPVLALAGDGDGDGWCVAAAKVEKVGRRFQFRPEDGAGAFVVVARDDAGWGVDLVAWEPKADWTAAWLGEVPMLGWENLLAQRGDGPLRVHRGMLSWLQGGRDGVVILAAAESRRLLENLTLQADDVDHGEAVRRLLTPPRPRIVVSAPSNAQAA